MKNILLLNDGYASLPKRIFYKVKGLLSYYVLPIAFKEANFDDWLDLSSTRLTSKIKMRRWIKDNAKKNTTLVAITKSYGCYEFYINAWRNYKDIAKYNRVIWICIDGHGSGYGLNRDFEMQIEWLRQMKVINLYQLKKYPKGARFLGAYVDKKIKTKDHWSIIKNKTVLDYVKKVCKGL